MAVILGLVLVLRGFMEDSEAVKNISRDERNSLNANVLSKIDVFFITRNRYFE